jgi:hypothetical protein
MQVNGNIRGGFMNPISLEEYKNAMREAVCNMCMFFAEDKQNANRCLHENSGQCSLFAHLDEVVDVVSSVDSGSIEPYTAALRQKVCAECDHQDERGVCNLRDNRGPVPVWCMLDAYFNLIVGAIEAVQERHA